MQVVRLSLRRRSPTGFVVTRGPPSLRVRQAGSLEVTSAYGQQGCGQPDDSTHGRNSGESQSFTDGLVGLCMASTEEETAGEVAGVEGRHVGGPLVERLAQPVDIRWACCELCLKVIL